MKVVTYLGFTVLSIFIQFCVMDFIQEKIQGNVNPAESNISHQKKAVDDLLKNITDVPHALYYRTRISKTLKRSPAAGSFLERIYSNTSGTAVPLGTTDITTTILDILYDENTSSLETTTTTETFLTTTEFDNITEITFFETKNKSSILPNAIPKINFSKYCGCNLLFKVCDINCCCDQDCTSDELKQFRCDKKDNNRLYSDGCISHLINDDLGVTDSFDTLFCVVKTNLPEKRSMKEPNLVLAGQYNKWKMIEQKQKLFEFKKTLYKQGDPIWLLKNGTIYYLDFPMPMVNSYCTDRAPIAFLKEENIKCTVKFSDLEMFHISKTEESMIISATESTFNSTTLNCSNLHCINWTILVCHSGICNNYNKSLNEASCTESICTNVALRIDYYFHYHNLKIINATIKLHVQKVLSNVWPFMSQEITVKFIMANKSLDKVIEFSGNPGYISYLPIIISNAKSNHTEHFFNSTSEKIHFILPENKNGICVLSNSSKNVVRFGTNKRTKCRYVHSYRNVTQNYTSVCKNIQDNINTYLGLHRDIFISPYGNPYGIKDKNWIKLQADTQFEPIYGEYSESGSKLHCFNLNNRVSVIFMYANVDENDMTAQNKVLFAKYEVVPVNISFNFEDFSTVLTIDINFVDVTKPNLYVYAGSPHLDIHLPKDFFFPFRPNNYCFRVYNSSIVTILCCILIFFSNKITLE